MRTGGVSSDWDVACYLRHFKVAPIRAHYTASRPVGPPTKVCRAVGLASNLQRLLSVKLFSLNGLLFSFNTALDVAFGRREGAR